MELKSGPDHKGKKKNESICFLIDSYLFYSKKVFLNDSDIKDNKDIILKFGKKNQLAIKNAITPNTNQQSFIKKIEYNELHRKFLIKSYLGLDLFLYESLEHFKNVFLNLSRQVDFNEYVMGIVNGYQTYALEKGKLNLYQFPQERNYSYKFLYYLTEAFLSPEFNRFKENFGMYILRWLKARLQIAMSIKDIEESLERYIFLLMDKENRWIWKYINPENELVWILSQRDLKQIILSGKRNRNRVLNWMKTRYCQELNESLFKWN